MMIRWAKEVLKVKVVHKESDLWQGIKAPAMRWGKNVYSPSPFHLSVNEAPSAIPALF